jgi:hypothetical protein
MAAAGVDQLDLERSVGRPLTGAALVSGISVEGLSAIGSLRGAAAALPAAVASRLPSV